MVALFVSSATKNLTGGENLAHNINGSPNSHKVDKFLFSKSLEFVIFSGLLPCPLKRSLYKVFST
jgi:hypothetical protein